MLNDPLSRSRPRRLRGDYANLELGADDLRRARTLGSPFDVEVYLGSFRQILTANGTKIRVAMRTLIARHPLCFWMDDVFVGSLMSSPVHTVGANTPLQNAGRLMLEHGIGSVIVVDDDGQLEGILTATDFIRLIAEGDPDPNATVSTSMSSDVTTTTANESIHHVADLMVEHDFHHVPVLDEGEVIGVITTTDLTAYLSSREEPSPS